MKRLMLYTQDMEGAGNVRRVMSLCQSLLRSFPDLAILIVAGSAMEEKFRIPDSIDYIKLPSLTTPDSSGVTDLLLKLRGDIILCSASNFKPDVMMVDTKPFGVGNELRPALAYLDQFLPATKVSLILPDIPNELEFSQEEWTNQEMVSAIDRYYDEISVFGSASVFDPREEYGFSPTLKAITRFRGYPRREPGNQSRRQVREELGLGQAEPLVLVLGGPGDDGTHIFVNYLAGVGLRILEHPGRSVLVFHPEMAPEVRIRLTDWADKFPDIRIISCTDDVMSYVDAADVVVAMAGYGNTCEILTHNKPAVVIPRVGPDQDQWIRAQRLEQLGVLRMIPPSGLTPKTLMRAVQEQFVRSKVPTTVQMIDLTTFPWDHSNLDSLGQVGVQKWPWSLNRGKALKG